MTRKPGKRIRPAALLIVLALAGSCRRPDPVRGLAPDAPPLPSVSLFDPSPDHPWNRIYAALNTWNTPGKPEALYTADPLHWPAPPSALTGAAQRAALPLLEEFLRTKAETLVADPLRRVIFQNALWLAFDWSVAGGDRELQRRLAAAMRRVAPSAEELRTIPDNYAQAAASKAHPSAFDPARPDDAFLPPDLLDPEGSWILLGDGANAGRDPIAQAHLAFFGGRSSFLLFLRLPGGRLQTADYVRNLADRAKPEAGPFPKGSHLALVRRMLAVDREGAVTPVPVVESVQIRVSGDFEGGTKLPGVFQRFTQWNLRRTDLFAGRAGGLHAAGPDDPEPGFVTLLGTGSAARHDRALSMSNPTRLCFTCHLASGANGAAIESYTRAMSRDFPKPDLRASAPGAEETRTVAWKRRQPSFAALMERWKEAAAERP